MKPTLPAHTHTLSGKSQRAAATVSSHLIWLPLPQRATVPLCHLIHEISHVSDFDDDADFDFHFDFALAMHDTR